MRNISPIKKFDKISEGTIFIYVSHNSEGKAIKRTTYSLVTKYPYMAKVEDAMGRVSFLSIGDFEMGLQDIIG